MKSISSVAKRQNRTPDDLLRDKRTCPEETVYQIGNIEETVLPEVLADIAAVFVAFYLRPPFSCLRLLDG